MTREEFAKKWVDGYDWLVKGIGKDGYSKEDMLDDLDSLSLTALISEHYVEREKYDELLRQRDELREALKQIRDTPIFVRKGSMDAYKMQHIVEAAIKSTER